MDLKPLVANRPLDEAEFMLGLIEKFQADVAEKLK
jgi:hypothetical protein